MTRLYRAHDGYTGQWSCWTPDADVASLYQDNPGYGGQQIAECVADGEILSVESFSDLAEALADDLGEDARDLVDRWTGAGYGWVYECWENDTRCRDAIAARYQWIRHHQETYPEGAETWVKI